MLGLLLAIALLPPLVLAPEAAVEQAQATPSLTPGIVEAGALPAADLDRAADERLSARISSALATAHQQSTADGLALAIVDEGQLVWAGAAGVDASGAPLLAEQAMVIGSITKTFVGALVLQLADEGRIDLAAPVGEYLTPTEHLEEVTIRQLLDHTSGLADIFNAETRLGLETDPDRSWTHAEVLATIADPWYEPGAGWAYANTNYLLLAMVAEAVTGATLEDEIARRFLGPLQLGSVRFLTPADGPAAPLAPAWTTIFWASGAMEGSVVDLARWGDALYRGDLLSTDARDAMRQFNGHEHGLGLQRLTIGGFEGIGHTGLLDRYTAILFHLPEDGLTVALLVNMSRADLGRILGGSPGQGRSSLLELAAEAD